MTNYRLEYKNWANFRSRLHHEHTRFQSNDSSYTPDQRYTHLKNYYTLMYHNLDLMFQNQAYEMIVNIYLKFQEKITILDSYFTEQELALVLEKFRAKYHEALPHVLKSEFDKIGVYYFSYVYPETLYLIFKNKTTPSLRNRYTALECYYIYFYYLYVKNDLTTALQYLEKGKDITGEPQHCLCLSKWGEHHQDTQILKSAFEKGDVNALIYLIQLEPDNPEWRFLYWNLLKTHRQNPDAPILCWNSTHPFWTYMKAQLMNYEYLIQSIPPVNYDVYQKYNRLFKQYIELLNYFSPTDHEYTKSYLEILNGSNPILDAYDRLQIQYDNQIQTMYTELKIALDAQTDLSEWNRLVHQLSNWEKNWNWNPEIQSSPEACYDFHIRIWKLEKTIPYLETHVKLIPEYGEEYFIAKQRYYNQS